jgi:tetratricopeptide (TPR) repeat protein
MKITSLTLSLLIFLGYGISNAQSKASPKEMFQEAESYFFYEEYLEALPIYQKLLDVYPQNDNINYRIGMCYLYIPYYRTKAITFLEKACQNISSKYKGSNLKEVAAPPDALYYLGDAYRINNFLDKAVAAYNKFKSNCDPVKYDLKMVDDQIRACDNARKLEKSPVKVSTTNLGELFNTHFAESNAVVSGDESTLVYTEQLQFYPAVFYSRKINGAWAAPLNINPDLEVDDDCFPVGLSFDGTEMILYRTHDFLGDLYVSRFSNGKWAKVKRLNGNINTKYWESHACLSRDGKKLYFTSNRKDSYGGLDIYVSTRSDVKKDDWGAAVNLGTVINSPFNEETPFITSDDQKLYFSSLGHNGMGGYDIFYAVFNKNTNTWGEPQNVGYPVNTTDNDLFYQPIGDGNEGYIALANNDTKGKTDIYKIKITAVPEVMASLNQTLKEPEVNVPTSEVKRSIAKQPASTPELTTLLVSGNETTNQSVKIITASLVTKSEERDSIPVDTLKRATKDTTDTVIIPEEKEMVLSSAQRKAWHSMLYGGLGIIGAFVLFFIFLFWKSRKRKK